MTYIWVDNDDQTLRGVLAEAIVAEHARATAESPLETVWKGGSNRGWDVRSGDGMRRDAKAVLVKNGSVHLCVGDRRAFDDTVVDLITLVELEPVVSEWEVDAATGAGSVAAAAQARRLWDVPSAALNGLLAGLADNCRYLVIEPDNIADYLTEFTQVP